MGRFIVPSYGDFMASFRHRPYVVVTVCVMLVFVLLYQSKYENTQAYRPEFHPETIHKPLPGYFDGRWNFTRDANNLLLTDSQCDAAFPGLYEEIERPAQLRKDRHITLKEINGIVPRNGYIRCLIYDQKVRLYTRAI